jgi:hypothetical protein
MGFSVRNNFSGGGAVALTAAKVDENFDDVESLVNGNLTTTNLSSGAAIANTQLANSYYEFLVNLQCTGVEWAAAAANGILALCALPTVSAGEGTYTIAKGAWVCTDCGAQTGKFRIEYGYFNAAGAWTVVTTPVAAKTLVANSAVNDTAGQGELTIANSSLAADASVMRFLALVMDTDEATTLTATPSFLTATLKIKHALRA